MQSFDRRKSPGSFRRISTPLALTLAFLLMGIPLAACGKSEDGSQAKSAASPAASKVNFDACALLAETDLAALLGEPPGEPNRATDKLLQSYNTENNKKSHCAISGKESGLYKSVFLMISYAGNKENPTDAKDAFDDRQKKEFEEMQMVTKEISGPGDLTIQVTSPKSFAIFVYWNKHYHLHITLNGMENQKIALEKSQALAQQIMSKL